ncbi:NAD-dependent epimerase/dehydratase family protein [Tropicimonas isoalkanivorans]|uniref:UDP-glucose 4-epimerase n=1 Tax=Tropicimonas isoalkanivorans TaxID=441112 RepID=A0A1I1LLV1_9RHOB|nr:NAD-dependent epimerase/dehydratase family protein [Tropicimonas isoalkanivorans]SFC73926.1 UDP-glucose 4-epimerase [Tropicimonas isoalkanivorans]
MTQSVSLEGKRILVTGGSGFVGSHIVDLLLEENCGEIIVVDNMVRGRRENLANALPDPRVKLIEGDIRDTALMDELVAGCDTVFHQAALRITHCAAEPDTAMAVMVQATYDLMQLCVKHEVRKVVYASSASIYGLAPHFPTPESDPPYDNRTLYGAAKSFGEGLLRSFNDMYGLDYVALRYFNVYGPRMDLHGKYTEVMVRWMERIQRGEPPIVFGDGLQTMDMIDVRDVARANILAAKAAASDEVFNVGSESETSLLGLARLLSEGMGRPDLVPEHAEERKVNPVPRRLAACGKAEEMLGFRASITPQDGLLDLINWWRNESTMVPEAAE